MRVAAGWAILGLLLAACGSGQPSVAATATADPPAAAPSSAPPATASPEPSTARGTAWPPSGLIADVDLGGRSIHVECRGTARPGVPILLFENGLDSPALSWRGVRSSLEALSTVCSYDRAGMGGSDPASEATRTIEDMADDLEAMLGEAGIVGPFLIVAHSMGPWVSTVYTSRHPDQVVGLVLVDPRGHRVTQRWLDELGEPTPGEPEVVTEVRAFVSDGFGGSRERLALAPSEAITGALLDAAGPFFGDRPVAVLSADGTVDEIWTLPDDLREAFLAVWLDDQRAFADESTRGTFTVVEGSGHMVMDDQPAAVVEAVEEMLEAIAAR